MSERPPPRSWPDAVVELVGPALERLGPLFLIVLAAGGMWWFLDRENVTREREHEAALTALRRERDAAFELISSNAESLADVTEKQIGNLSSVLGVMAEAEARGARVRDLADAARAREAELTRSREELDAATAELGTQREAFARKEKELERREASLRVSAGRLAGLEGALSALEAAAREDLEAARREVGAAGDLIADLSFGAVAPDDPRVERTLAALDRLRFGPDALGAGLDAATTDYADVIVDPAAVLAPLARLEGWRFDAAGPDRLIGVSLARMAESVSAEDGMGFDTWSHLRNEDGEEGLFAFVAQGPRFRGLILVLGGDPEALRIDDHEFIEGVAPAGGLSRRDPSADVVAVAGLSFGEVDVFERPRPEAADERIPFLAIFEDEVEELDRLYGPPPTLPVLGLDAVAALAENPELPAELRAAFDPRRGAAGVPASMLAVRGEFDARLERALAALPPLEGLAPAVRDAFREARARLDRDDSPERRRAAALAAKVLQPGFRLVADVDGRRVATPPPPGEAPVGETDDRLERIAVVRVESDWPEAGPRIVLSRDSTDLEWRRVSAPGGDYAAQTSLERR